MRILMISNHLGVQSGVQRYVQNLLLNLDTTKYKVDLFVGLGGLGEGFSSFRNVDGEKIFDIH